MTAQVEVKCVACGTKRWEGPRADQPMCATCFMPMVPTGKAKAGAA